MIIYTDFIVIHGSTYGSRRTSANWSRFRAVLGPTYRINYPISHFRPRSHSFCGTTGGLMSLSHYSTSEW